MDAEKLIADFEANYNSVWAVDLDTAVKQRGTKAVLVDFINWIKITQ